MTTTLPDYSNWSTADLNDEATRQDKNRRTLAGETLIDESTRRVRIAKAGARYHAACAVLVARAEPFDAEAKQRAARTLEYHRRETKRFIAVQLGCEYLSQHDADAMGQVRA
ncbi:hypothetical protein [Salinicola rhizosphaerae]|uniref:Uncharacterized protein n=1 Tax=Salinicola rhizosphaerae TaxID=1443141 RepID=A0ABQ3EB05_9GAMM|nr:hypothetical protein [Salinicola rhizosphaerae]GHB30708.1 hypothetical protein GCM10009038_31880 [Salinicola rhizosphaerae]